MIDFSSIYKMNTYIHYVPIQNFIQTIGTYLFPPELFINCNMDGTEVIARALDFTTISTIDFCLCVKTQMPIYEFKQDPIPRLRKMLSIMKFNMFKKISTQIKLLGESGMNCSTYLILRSPDYGSYIEDGNIILNVRSFASHLAWSNIKAIKNEQFKELELIGPEDLDLFFVIEEEEKIGLAEMISSCI